MWLNKVLKRAKKVKGEIIKTHVFFESGKFLVEQFDVSISIQVSVRLECQRSMSEVHD